MLAIQWIGHKVAEEVFGPSRVRQVLTVGSRSVNEAGQVFDVREELARYAERAFRSEQRLDVVLHGHREVRAEIGDPLGVSPGRVGRGHRVISVITVVEGRP